MRRKRVLSLLLAAAMVFQGGGFGALASEGDILSESEPEVGVVPDFSETDTASGVIEEDSSGAIPGSGAIPDEGSSDSLIEEESEDNDQQIQWLWLIDDEGRLTLTGSGNVEPETVPWLEHAQLIQSVVVDSGITGLGDGLFDGCVNLKKIEFQGSAPEIAQNAFEGLEADAVYPADDITWTDDSMLDYGGTITWHASSEVEETAQPEATQPEAAQPEAAQPEAAQQEPTQSEAAQSESTQSDAAQTEISLPEASTETDAAASSETGTTSSESEAVSSESELSSEKDAEIESEPETEGKMEEAAEMPDETETELLADALPDEIEQTYSVVRLKENPKVQALQWHITVGSLTDDASLEGFTLKDTAEGMGAEFLRLTDADGDELQAEKTEDGFTYAFPDGAAAPYEVNAVFQLEEGWEEGEVTNTVELSHVSLLPSGDSQWTDTQTAELKRLLSWEEYYAKKTAGMDLSSMSDEQFKQLYVQLRDEYAQYKAAFQASASAAQGGLKGIRRAAAMTGGSGTFSNDYLEVAINGNGQFTIGTNKGDPDYDTDDDQKLLYGHPNPGTSETKIKIDDDEYVFTADKVWRGSDYAVASMDIEDHNVTVIETLKLIQSGNTSYTDTVEISYSVQNNGSSPVSAGVRIMLDTMLASNDGAPFRIPNIGNLTTIRTFTGSDIPAFYQVYDDLDSPTTLATGYLITTGNRAPDKVQFTHWSDIRGSYWDYTADDGDDLGDSAVGVYFNPVSVAAGSSIDVSTRYGVGLGAKGNSNTQTLDADHVQIKVINANTKEAIAGATLLLANGSSYTTEDDGTVLVPLDAVNGKTIHASMTDYEDNELTTAMEGGRQYTIKLKKAGDTAPVITSVMYENTNLLTDAAGFTEDTSKVLSKPENQSKIKKVKIQVNSDTQGCTYYLYKENEQVDRNQSGIFEFDSMEGNHGDRDYISSLSAGKRYFVKCVEPSTGKSDKEQILLKVYSPRLSFHADLIDDLNNGKFNFWPETWADAKDNLLLNMLAGGDSSFSLKGTPASITAKYDFQSQTLKIGLNASGSLMEDKTAQNSYKNCAQKVYQYSKRANASDEDKKEAEKAQKELDDAVKRWQKSGKSEYTIGTVSFNVNFMGYGEFKAIATDKFSGSMYFSVSANLDATKSFNFPPTVIPVPMYITIGAHGKLSLSVGAPVEAFSGKEEFMNALKELLDSFSVYAGVSFEAGVGNTVVANIGGKVEGGINLNYNFKSTYLKTDLTASGSFVAKALIWSWSYPIANASVTIFDKYLNEDDDTSMAKRVPRMTLQDILSDEENATLISRDYAELGAGNSSGDTDSTVTMSGVYTAATPQLVTANGHSYKFWLQDIASRESQNRTALVYSVDGGDMHIVEDDGTADYAYSVCVDGTDIYTAWMDCSQVFDSSVKLSGAEKSLDITLARIDTSSDNATKVYAVSSDSTLDQLPAVYAHNGTVTVAWNSMDSGFFDPVSGSRLNYRTLQQDTLSDTSSVSLPDRTMEDLQIRPVNESLQAVYTTIVWDEDSAKTSQQTGYVSLNTKEISGETIATAETVPLTAKLNGQDTLFWYGQDNYWYVPVGGNGADAEAVFGENGAGVPLSGIMAVVGDGDRTCLIWAGKSGSDTASKVYMTVFENGEWGPAYQIADLGEGTIENLTAALNGDGKTGLSWQRTQYDEVGNLTASDLCSTEIDSYTDLALDDISYDPAGAAEGTDYTITLTLRNAGNTVIDQAEAVIDGNSISLDGLALQPGQTVKKDVTFTVEHTGPYVYEVSVNTAGDRNDSNQTESFSMGHSRLHLGQVKDILQDGEEMLFVEIVNDAGFDTDDITLRIFGDDQMSILLYQTFIEEVKAGGSVFAAIPVSIFSSTNQAYAYLLAEDDNETMEDIVPDTLTFSDDTVEMVRSYSLDVSADEGGDVAGGSKLGYYATRCYSGDKVEVKAQPFEGYAFWQWTSNNGGTFEDAWNASTTFTMPDSDVGITAEFRRINEPESLEVPEERIEASAGDTILISPTVTPADTSEHITYTSSDETVAAVDRNGEVKALQSGRAVITVKCGDLEKTVEINISDVKAESLSLITPVYMDGIGSVEKMKADWTPSNATQKLVWTSSDETVAKVDQDGTVTSTGCGTAVITAAVADNPEIRAECTVHVNAPVEQISLSERKLTVGRGESREVTASFAPANIPNLPDVEWTAYDDIVTLTPSGSHGETVRVTGNSTGSTRVEARIGDLTASFEVSVTAPARSISIQQDSLTLKEGRESTLTMYTDPADTTSTVMWESSDSRVASVDDEGCVYANAAGTAVITVRTDNGLSDQCTVTVIPAVTYASTVEGMQSEHNYSNNMDDSWIYTLPGAHQLEIVFSGDTATESRYDYIYVYDRGGNQIGRYDGNKLAGATLQIPGDTVKIRLKTDGSYTEYGFRLVSITAVHSYADEFTVDRAPTCFAEGERSRHCTVCGARTDIQSIPKIPSSINLNASSIPLKVGQKTRAIMASGLADGDFISSWTSSNKKIVTVKKNGALGVTITGKKKGTAKVTVVTAAGAVQTLTVKVQKSKVKTSRIQIAVSKKLSMKKGEKISIGAVRSPLTSVEKITYKSSNKKVAKVSGGKIRALKKGKATITITSGKKKVKIKVTVK